MIDTKIYNVTKMKQLIDLNKDIIDFDLTFKTTCENKEQEYQLLVVDQNTLDSGEPIEYKTTTGSLSGNIISDKGIYKNYLLILKSDNDCRIKVEIDCKPLEKLRPKPIVPTDIITKEDYKNPISQFTNPIFELPYNYKIGIVVGISILIMYYGYNKWIEYNNKKNSKEIKVPSNFKVSVPDSGSESGSDSVIANSSRKSHSPLPKGIGVRFNKLIVH